MQLKPRRGSWILVLLFVIAWVSPITARVHAAVEPGLSATVYNNYGYNNAPPLPTVSGRPVQCTNTYLSINQDFGNNICGLYDDFIVKYEGYITSPTTETYTLYMHGDDGVKLYLDDVLKVDAWYDSGNAGATTEISFVAGVPQNLLAWYYENGGGNWVKLEYLVDGVYYPVPDSWFTQTNEPTNTTTTTLAPYFNTVQNLTATANNDGSVNLAWDAPSASNTEIYGYSINFVDYDNNVERGGWGVWTLAANTTYSLGHWMFDGSNPVTTGYGQVRFKVYAMSGPCAGVGSGSCLYGPSTNVDATVLDPTPSTTTTVPPTTTTTTLPLTQGNNGCGPYRAFTVTGTTGGTIWGSGPYTDDSAFAAAAVHAGLIQVGQTAVIEPYAVDNYLWYDASYANGVYTNDWHSSWCGYQIKLLGSATPTTTTTTTSTTTTTLVSTTTTSTTTTTTSTTTTIVPEPETTTTTEPEPEITTTTISPTTTTVIETIFDPVDTPDNNLDPVTTPEVDSTPVVIPEDITPEIIVPKDTQEAADAAVEDIFDGPMSDGKLSDAVDDLVAGAETPEEITAVVGSLLDQELTDAQFSTVIESIFSEPLSDDNFAAAVDAVFEDPTKLSDAQFEDAVTAVFDAPLSDKQFHDAVAAVFKDTKSLSDEQFDAAVQAVFDEPLTTEQFSAALDAVFDEPITDEKFGSIIDAVLDEPLSDEQFEELVGVLESETITEEQVAAAVDSVIENGVTEDQATDLATSKKVLESIDTDQAAEIFDAIPVGDLSVAEEEALVAAVSDAPDEIKDEFETQIDVYGEGLDNYVPTGSQVDVGSRRTLLAATAALSAATVGMGPGTGSSGPSGGSGGSGGGSGGSGGGPGDGSNSNGRKEDEDPDGEEEDTEIEGPEDQEDNNFTRNSIFKY